MTMSKGPREAFHTLRYRRPADAWTDALPVGNGLRAAMCEGRPGGERLWLNEGTAWSGPTGEDPLADAPDRGPEALAAVRAAIDDGDLDLAERLVRRQQTPWAQAFLPFGTLDVAVIGARGADRLERTLDLSTGIAAHEYSSPGIGRVRHETWADAVTGALVHRIIAPEPVRILVRLHGPFPDAGSADAADHLVAHWHLPIDVPPGHASPGAEIRYDITRGRLGAVVVRTSAASVIEDGALRTAPAREHVITMGTATADASGDAIAEARSVADAVGEAAAARAAHIVAHRELYDRCALELPASDDPRTTDERIRAAEEHDDPALAALAFHYGRYLLLSSSRPGGLPANLQGIWNAELPGPWSSGYTTNINLQMAYWPAETTNLAECHQPLIDFVRRTAHGAGAVAARELYGTDGWVLHHNTDPWGHGAAVGEGIGDANWSTWPMGGVWLSLHLWDRWLFGGGMGSLRNEAWPVLEATARFALSWIRSDGDHAWTSPSTSPENLWLDSDGAARALGLTATMDAELLRALSAACTAAAGILGRDDVWVEELAVLIAKLPPLTISGAGRVQEWSADVPDADPSHRHLSHLVGLFPLGHVTPDATPELAAAAARSILGRGPESSGWSLAWRALMWARLRDGERVHGQLRMLLRPAEGAGEAAHRGGAYRNLFSAHPPFQIDGNLGFTAAVAEALVQSHDGGIRLLPALPAAWPAGRITGIRARGGVTLDLQWDRGEVARVALRSERAQRVRLQGPGLPEREVDLPPERTTIIETKEIPW